MLTVDKIMKTRVATARFQTGVRDAMETMAEAGIRHLPVVDDAGRLIGMVSHRDAVRALDVARTIGGQRTDVRVGDIMKTEVLRALPGMAAHQAASMMIESRIGSLPVVADNGRLVGIITETDFLEVAREALIGVDAGQRARA
jgi:CBS domain-containing protein